MNFITRPYIFCVLLFLCSFQTQFIYAQCNPSALEIPLNGIDEDCDSLDDLYLHLPAYVYLLENQDFELYFSNIILSKHPLDYTFEVLTDLPSTNLGDRWQYTPAYADVGEHQIWIKVKDTNGTTLAEGNTTLRITPRQTQDSTQELSVFLLGHSFIDQGYMPAYLNDLVEEPGNPKFTFHGSRKSWIDNTRHEAIGGASWQYFYDNPASPFFFDSVFNMRAYLDTFLCKSCTPDLFVIHLDVNDFNFQGFLSGDDFNQIDQYIDTVHVKFMEPFLESLHSIAPRCKIAVCFTPPPNHRDSAFVNYFGAASILSDRYRWEKIVSRIKFKYRTYFESREQENIWILPIHLDINTVTDFSPTDPVHPHPNTQTLAPPSGYLEIAKNTYAWMKYTIGGTVGVHPTTNKPSNYQVYPNPVKDVLTISYLDGKVAAESIEIYSIFGNKVSVPIVLQSNSIQINTNFLKSGVHIVRFQDSNESIQSFSFIKI